MVFIKVLDIFCRMYKEEKLWLILSNLGVSLQLSSVVVTHNKSF